MPVIGRLDEQVNDVLIDPARRRRRLADGDDAPTPPDGARRDETDEHARAPASGTTTASGAKATSGTNVASGTNGAASRTRANDDAPSEEGDEQLPVWLL